jgi:phosphoesterase RecJ-like protein
MSSPQTTSDVAAVADAIRSHDRFLLVTHENPDGDALGSILALKLALDQLGKDSVMYLYGDAPAAGRVRSCLSPSCDGGCRTTGASVS